MCSGLRVEARGPARGLALRVGIVTGRACANAQGVAGTLSLRVQQLDVRCETKTKVCGFAGSAGKKVSGRCPSCLVDEVAWAWEICHLLSMQTGHAPAPS